MQDGNDFRFGIPFWMSTEEAIYKLKLGHTNDDLISKMAPPSIGNNSLGPSTYHDHLSPQQ